MIREISDRETSKSREGGRVEREGRGEAGQEAG